MRQLLKFLKLFGKQNLVKIKFIPVCVCARNYWL